MSDGIEVVTLEQDTHVISTVAEIAVVTVGEAGPAGPAGPPGSAAGTYQATFAYGDASPAIVATVPAGKVVYEVEIAIVTPFDGAGAALSVGDAGLPDRLMTLIENDPTQRGSNTTAPAYQYASDTDILLTITPGAGASQGNGIVFIRTNP